MSTKQCDRALDIANGRRQARVRIKQGAKRETLTFGEVVIAAPDSVSSVRLADILQWGWPRLGPSRQMKIGRLAAREDLNVLLPIGKASRATRTAFVSIVGEVRGDPQEYASSEARSETRDDDLERMAWLLKKTERERDAALGKVAELERTMTVHQAVMPTLEAERMVAELADAIEIHRRTVSNEKLPPERWCMADPELWKAKDDILAGLTPMLRVA